MHRLVVVAGAVLLVAGCSQSGDSPAGFVSAPASAEPSTELGSCLVGTWDLDAGFVESMLLEATRSSLERDQLGGTIESTLFAATQTTTFAPDGTFATQMSLSTDMTMEVTDFEGVALPPELQGLTIPASYDSAGTATGTWAASTTSFSTTIDSTDVEETMMVDGEMVAGPGAFPVLLPDAPTPVSCSDSTLTIPIGTTTADSVFPDELVFTRHQ